MCHCASWHLPWAFAISRFTRCPGLCGFDLQVDPTSLVERSAGVYSYCIPVPIGSRIGVGSYPRCSHTEARMLDSPRPCRSDVLDGMLGMRCACGNVGGSCSGNPAVGACSQAASGRVLASQFGPRQPPPCQSAVCRARISVTPCCWMTAVASSLCKRAGWPERNLARPALPITMRLAPRGSTECTRAL